MSASRFDARAEAHRFMKSKQAPWGCISSKNDHCGNCDDLTALIRRTQVTALARAEVIVRGWCDHADEAANAIARERNDVAVEGEPTK